MFASTWRRFAPLLLALAPPSVVLAGVPASTQTVLAIAPAAPVPSQALILTATVTRADAQPGGTVDFLIGGATACDAVALDSETGNATCHAPGLETGDHVVRADFTPADPIVELASSDENVLTIEPGETTTEITSVAPSPSWVGEPVAIAVAVVPVAPSTGSPTGSVLVTASSGESCTVTLPDPACTIVFATAATRNLIASYAGSAEYIASETQLATSHSVTPSPTEIVLTERTPLDVSYRQPLTVSFEISAANGTIPTGTATASLGLGETCGPVTLVAGGGSCTLTPNVAGSRTLTLNYLPADPALHQQSSTTLSQTVAKANPTPQLFHTPEPSSISESVVATGTLAGVPGGAAPSGSITIARDATIICSRPLLNGSASPCSTSFTSAGEHSFTLAYPGDTRYNAAELSVAHIVGAHATTVHVSVGAPEPARVGEPYAVDVRVSRAPAGAIAGSVTVADDVGGTCTISELTAGEGTCSLSSPAAGTRVLTATFTSSDPNVSGSAGTATQDVLAGDTVLSFIAESGSTRVGQATRFELSLAVQAPALGLPSGTVTVTAGELSCSAPAAPLVDCEIALPAVCVYTVTAQFVPADANFNESETSEHEHTVFAQADVAVTIEDDATHYVAHQALVYEILLANDGPDAARGLDVTATVTPMLIDLLWECTGQAEAVCPALTGSGPIDLANVHLPASGSLAFTLSGVAPPSATGDVVAGVAVELPGDGTVVDLDSADRAAQDVNVPEILLSDGFESGLPSARE